MLEPDSPFMIKQQEINKPKRRASISPTKIQIQQFVQSEVFQETFNNLITTLDIHHKTRR